ncbi:MAG TPA: metallophosphoesterase family protein [Gaiellaceae bacterium]|nr:metallophosphoesterase family protein [Gaiellaceae bacterium]
MRVAVISDIHANLHALEAVADAVDRESPDAIWCLGDLVGYGPEPNACCAWAVAHTQLSLVGNHDLGVIGTLDLAEFSEEAAAAARWTRGVLSSDSHDYLASLAPSAEREGIGLFHGSPRNPVWEYVLTWDVARESMRRSSTDVTIVGHSHVPLAIGSEQTGTGGHAPDGTEVDFDGGRWLLNPGSVGQPRDGNAAAAWLLLDLEARHASFRREPYDVARTQAEMREHRLPETLAERLAYGV